MRLERYQEDDMRKAMAKVRTELGNDAVIISSRKVAGRSEIMAASEYDPELLEAEIKKLSSREPSSISNLSKGKSKEESKSKSTDESKVEKNNVWQMLSDEKDRTEEKAPSLVSMQDELARLRKLFEGELAQLAWRDTGKQQPNRLALLTRLETAGISRDIAARLVEKVLPCNDLELGWRQVLRLLSRVIKTADHDVLTDGGVIAMLGPTGVGKTTTAAKIAAQFALRHGRKQVAFVTTDSYRVGGQEQLISLGSILGIPVQIANNNKEMQKTLDSFSERKLVIIDTAGISQRDAGLVEQFESLNSVHSNILPHLVLSATSQESVINETIKAFSSVDLSAAIITKTDECSSMGAILSGLLRNKLPAAFIGNGQQVPEDLMPASAEVFTNNIIQSYNDSQIPSRKRRTRKKSANV